MCCAKNSKKAFWKFKVFFCKTRNKWLIGASVQYDNAGYKYCSNLTPSRLVIIWVRTQGFAASNCLISYISHKLLPHCSSTHGPGGQCTKYSQHYRLTQKSILNHIIVDTVTIMAIIHWWYLILSERFPFSHWSEFCRSLKNGIRCTHARTNCHHYNLLTSLLLKFLRDFSKISHVAVGPIKVGGY